jgi:hypothetical protein
VFSVSSRYQDEKQLLESYRRIKRTYDEFRKLQEKLGKPRRGLFTAEITAGDISAKDLFEEIKRSKEKMGENV